MEVIQRPVQTHPLQRDPADGVGDDGLVWKPGIFSTPLDVGDETSRQQQAKKERLDSQTDCAQVDATARRAACRCASRA
jgi:hypothetical protein